MPLPGRLHQPEHERWANSAWDLGLFEGVETAPSSGQKEKG